MDELKLKNYHALLKVKPPSLKPLYPYVEMDETKLKETIKQIELVYQNIVLDDGKKRERPKIVRGGQITVVTF